MNFGRAAPHHLLNHAAKHDELEHHLKKSRHSSSGRVQLELHIVMPKLLSHTYHMHQAQLHCHCDAAHTRQEVKKLSATALLEYRFRKVIRKPKPTKIMIDT